MSRGRRALRTVASISHPEPGSGRVDREPLRSSRPAGRGLVSSGAASADVAVGVAHEAGPESAANRTFRDYFRCPPVPGALSIDGHLSSTQGYFRFDGTICYGRLAGRTPVRYAEIPADVGPAGEHALRAGIPFDLSEVVVNLQQERYRQRGTAPDRAITSAQAASAICITWCGRYCRSACASTSRRCA